MSLAKNSLLFTAGTLLSRVSGLLRDQVIAAVLGAGVLQDAFNVAFRIPNLLRDMLAEGALSNSFTKVYTSLGETAPDQAQKLLRQTLQFIVLFGGLLCFAGIVFAPQLVDLMTVVGKDQAGALAQNPEFLQNTIGLTRWLFPYLLLVMLGSIAMGALHKKGRFFLSAVSPLGFNGGNIVGALMLGPLLARYFPAWTQSHISEPVVAGLALGVLLGGVTQLFMQARGIFRELRGIWRCTEFPWSRDLRHVFVLMFPAAIAASSGPINGMINTNFATSLGEGTVSWINMAFRFLQLPVGIFGVAIGSAVLPSLSRAMGKNAPGDRRVNKDAAREFQMGLELVVWTHLPCLVFLMVNNLPLMDVVFHHGRMDEFSIQQTAAALFAYSFGLLSYGLIKVFTAFYFSVERTRYAMLVSMISIAVNFVGNALLTKALGFQGLAWTATLALSVNATVLYLGTRKESIAWDRVLWGKTFRGGLLALALAWCAQKLVITSAAHLLGDDWVFDSGVLFKLTLLALNGALVVFVFGLLAEKRFPGWVAPIRARIGKKFQR